MLGLPTYKGEGVIRMQLKYADGRDLKLCRQGKVDDFKAYGFLSWKLMKTV